MLELARDCDVFFANRRPGYLNHFNLGAEELAEARPGIIHVEMSLYGPTGPWADRTGFDQNAGAVTGVLAREGTLETRQLTEIFVINDYAMSWLAAMAVMATLKRRTAEGGSYRIHLSLRGPPLWLIQTRHLRQGLRPLPWAATTGDHAYLDPEVFQAETPNGPTKA